MGSNYLVVDVETEVGDGRFGSSIDDRNHLMLACARLPGGGYYSHWGGEYDQVGLLEAIQSVDFIVAHNAKYELGWLTRCGMDISKLLVFDTKLAEYVLLGNLVSGDRDNGVKPIGISLNDCGIRRGNAPKDAIVDIWMQHGIKVSQMPAKWVLDRCQTDVDTTHRIFLDQRNRLQRTNRLGVLYTRCMFTPVLSSIEKEGMHLDKERVASTTEKYRAQLKELSAEFDTLTGGINFRSPKQVAGYLYDTLGFEEPKNRDGTPRRTAKGGRLANKRILDKLHPSTDAQRAFLSLKRRIGSVSSALSKNLEYFKEICDERDGTFHAEFNQAITATHRLSCTGIKEVSEKSVQLQNVPRDFKCLFNAKRPGWLIGEADGAQLEFRVAGHCGNDNQIKRDIADPTFDAHCVTASEMYGKDYSKLRADYLAGDKKASQLRQLAKPFTFQPLYGGKGSTKESQRWAEAFKKRYHELAKTQESWVYEVLASKRLVTEWGMRYYFPTARISSTGYVNVGNAVYNYPIQALATAEIIPVSVSYFWHHIKAQGLDQYIVPVSTVHDSLICEVEPNHVEDFIRIAQLAFGPNTFDYLRTVYGMDYTVPLGIGIKIGEHWGEGKEEIYEYFNGKTERKS
jgi:DNA polymerase I-like protein with 3'-5' exonuclease and polymerase domains